MLLSIDSMQFAVVAIRITLNVFILYGCMDVVDKCMVVDRG